MPGLTRVMEEYRRLVEKVEGFSLKVREAYPDQILCGEGCSECCRVSFKVFPIEAWALKNWWEDRGGSRGVFGNGLGSQSEGSGIRDRNWGACVFLLEDRCVVYPARPIICRTQGLPMLARDEKGKTEVRFCKRNLERLLSRFTIKGEFLLDLEVLNATLVALNELFRKNWEEFSSQPLPQRVELPYFLRI